MTSSHWPRLATLPSTNAAISTVLVLWLLTGFCALAHWAPADRWYQGLETFTTIVVVQFIGKRFSFKPGAPAPDAGNAAA